MIFYCCYNAFIICCWCNRLFLFILFHWIIPSLKLVNDICWIEAFLCLLYNFPIIPELKLIQNIIRIQSIFFACLCQSSYIGPVRIVCFCLCIQNYWFLLKTFTKLIYDMCGVNFLFRFANYFLSIISILKLIQYLIGI